MKNYNLIRCTRISVDCVNNDPVDIRCSGPNYLGFDFNVKQEEEAEMVKFIALALENFEVPLVHIGVSGTIDLDENKVWTKERIIEAIQKDAEYLRAQAERKYEPPIKKIVL